MTGPICVGDLLAFYCWSSVGGWEFILFHNGRPMQFGIVADAYTREELLGLAGSVLATAFRWDAMFKFDTVSGRSDAVKANDADNRAAAANGGGL